VQRVTHYKKAGIGSFQDGFECGGAATLKSISRLTNAKKRDTKKARYKGKKRRALSLHASFFLCIGTKPVL
jgi:hypothetical protein